MFILSFFENVFFFLSIESPQSKTTENASKRFEQLVDEKCRHLNKNGTSHDSALHLAQWMKGQFDESVIQKKNFIAPL